MENKKIDSEVIADALINLCNEIGFCDKDTAKGFKSSKKKEILKSSKEKSFSKFTCKIIERQNRKI